MKAIQRISNILQVAVILGLIGYLLAQSSLEAGALRAMQSGVDVGVVLLNIVGVVGLGMLGLGLRTFMVVAVAIWQVSRE